MKYNLVNNPLIQLPINQGVVQTYTVLTLIHSQEGVQAVQALNLRYSVLTPGLEWVQAMKMLIPRQTALIPPQLVRSAGRAGTHSQVGQSLSPSEGTSVATGGEAASSLDNTASVTKEQGLRPGRQAPQLPPKPGPQHTQPRSSRSSPQEGGKQPQWSQS